MARRPKPIDTSTAPGHAAYKLGLTGGSYKAYRQGQVPLALAEKSPGGIQRAAAQMTRQAYAPAARALNTQERRLKDLQVKREADNTAFAQWVQSRGDTLRAEAIGQANATRDRLAQGQSEFATQLQNIRDSATANLQRQGVTQPIGGADAAQLGAHQAAGQASTLAASNAATAHVGANTQSIEATLANNPAVVAAARAKDLAQSLDELAKLGDTRTKVALQQGADHARNVQSLLNQEITKAQAIIAAQQFSTKTAEAGRQKSLDRRTSLKKTKITAGGTAKNAGGQPAPVPSYTRDEWNRHASSWRKRKLDAYNKSNPSGKGQPSPAAQQKATAKAEQQLSTIQNAAKGAFIPSGAKPSPANPKPTPRPPAQPGNVKKLAQWLIAMGYPEALSNIAAQKAVYPKKPIGGANKKQYDKYVKSLLGSR